MPSAATAIPSPQPASTGTFQFYVAPSVHVTLTQTEHAVLTLPGPNEGTHVYSQDLPQGIIQRGVTPLGPWRAFGIGDYSDRILLFPSYSIGAIPPSLDAFVPSGVFPQIAFFDPLNPARHIGGDGTTRVDYHIRAHGP